MEDYMNTIYNYVESAINKTKEFKGSIIESILDFPSLYCVTYSPEKPPSGDYYVDSFLSVDKKTGKVEPYNPLLDRESFKKASKNPVYLRSKDLKRPEVIDKGKELVHSMLM